MYGSWVASTWRMAGLVAELARRDLHPQVTVTDRFPLAETGLAYAASDAGTGGKVAVVMD